MNRVIGLRGGRGDGMRRIRAGAASSRRAARNALCGAAATAVLIGLSPLPASATSFYWDANSTTSGAGTTPAGTWGTDTFWSTAVAGDVATGAWSAGNTAVFSAGGDATSAYTVTISGTQSVGGINIEEGNPFFTGGTIDMGASGVTIDTAPSTATTLSGTSILPILSGTGARLTKTGAGTLIVGTVLNTANTFDNGVTVDGGVLEFPGEVTVVPGASNALGKYPATATAGYIRIGNGTLRSTRISTGSTAFLGPNRGVTLLGDAKLEVTDPSTDNSLVYTGVIAGSGSLTKIGVGALRLNGANTYSGDTFASAGFLGLDTSGTLGSGVLHLVGGTLSAFGNRESNPLANAVDMQVNTTLQNNGASAGRRIFPFGTTNFTASNGAALTIRNVGAAASTFAGQFTADSFSFNFPITLDRGVNNAPLRLEFVQDVSGATSTFAGVISGNGAVRRNANAAGAGGNTELTAANTYSGGTDIDRGYVGLGANSAGAVGALTSGPVGVGPITFGANGSADDSSVGLYAAGAARSVDNDINFSSITHVTFKGSNALTLGGAVNLGSASRTLTVADPGGVVTLSNTVAGAASVGITKDGSGMLVLNGANTYSGNTTVNQGKLVVGQSLITSPAVSVQNDAVLELASTGSGTTVVRTGTIAVGASARIDVKDNKLVTTVAVGTASGGIYNGVSGLIQSGRNGGAWNGSGIVTSKTDAVTSNLTSIGVASAQQAKALSSATDTAVWAGQTVTGSDTLVMYTYGGDANLDGKITISDYGKIDFSIGIPDADGWANGDFNYDGKITISDYGIIDFNVGMQGPPLFAGGGVADHTALLAVPEPAAGSSLVFLLASACGLRRRRR